MNRYEFELQWKSTQSSWLPLILLITCAILVVLRVWTGQHAFGEFAWLAGLLSAVFGMQLEISSKGT